MKKIVIIGSSGAGKSTFAQALGGILDIKVFHLDNYFWQCNWQEYAREERIAIEQKLIERNAHWIIEGSYFGSAENRLNAADIIIFLDMPSSLCLWRAITRHIKYLGCERRDIPQGCTDRIDLLRIWKILLFPYTGRRSLLAKLDTINASQVDGSPQKTIVRLRSRKQVKAFLQQWVAEWQKDAILTELKLAC